MELIQKANRVGGLTFGAKFFINQSQLENLKGKSDRFVALRILILSPYFMLHSAGKK